MSRRERVTARALQCPFAGSVLTGRSEGPGESCPDHPYRGGGDPGAILAVVRHVFATGGHDSQEEVDIVETTWSLEAGWLELVAVDGGDVVGQALTAYGDLGGGRWWEWRRCASSLPARATVSAPPSCRSCSAAPNLRHYR